MSESWDRPAAGPANPDAWAPTTPAPPGYPPAGYAPPPGYFPPGYLVPAKNSSDSIAVVSLGIASIALTIFCAGVGVIPAIIALVMAGRAQREIEASGGRLDGLQLIKAGRITSWIGIGINLLLVLGVVVFLVLVFSTSTVGP